MEIALSGSSWGSPSLGRSFYCFLCVIVCFLIVDSMGEAVCVVVVGRPLWCRLRGGGARGYSCDTWQELGRAARLAIVPRDPAILLQGFSGGPRHLKLAFKNLCFIGCVLIIEVGGVV